MEIKPLPCPWCGVIPGVYKTKHGGVYFECTNYACPVQPQSQVFSTMEKLTKKWNERSSEKPNMSENPTSSNCTACILDGTDACSRGAGRAVDGRVCEDFVGESEG